MESDNLLIFDISDSDDAKNDEISEKQNYITDEAFFEKLKMKAVAAAKVMDVHPDVAMACLQFTHWNEPELILKFSEEFPIKFTFIMKTNNLNTIFSSIIY